MRLIPPTLALLALAKLSTSAATTFENRSVELGISGGNEACWFDFDNDGWVDLCTGGKVFRNEEGKRFAEFATTGASVAADFDNDGFLDLYSWASRKIYHNEAGKGFKEIAMPELPKGSSLGACWGDFNNDGYEVWPAETYADFILTNKAGKSFELSWSEVRYRARGVTACDFDRDGDLDVYVSNYRLQPNILWQNQGELKDVAAEFGALADSPGFGGGHSIGAAWGDFDNDGDMDLFAGNFAHKDGRGNQPESCWLRNGGAGQKFHFENLGQRGVRYQESYASPAAADFDNDGDLDLFFTTVYGVASFGRKNHAVLFRNDGGFNFADATGDAGLGGLPPTYQAAWADFDNDGDLDLMSGGSLFENKGDSGAAKPSWLKLRLVGDGKAVNRAAIGAQVRIKLADGNVLTRQVEAGTGQGNQNELVLHFGLGEQRGPVDLEIFWPGKKTEIRHGVAIGRLQTIEHPDLTVSKSNLR